MSAKLTQICPLFNPESFTNSFLLLKDSIFQPGGFFLSEFLSSLSKNPSDSFVFMGLDQNFSHYSTISKKLGSNLENMINSGQMFYIDFFSRFSNWIASDLPITEEPPLTWKEVPNKGQIFSGFSAENFEKLFEKIENFGQNKEKIWLFVDNLNLFLNSLESPKDYIGFVNSLIDLVKNKSKKFNLVILGSSDDEIEKNQKMLQLLEINANLVIEIQNNSSGYSKDVDGNVCFLLIFINYIFFLKMILNFKDKEQIFKFLYKVNENSLSFHGFVDL